MKNFSILAFLLVVFVALSSASQTGSSCKYDSDCPVLNTCQQNTCVHRPLFPPTAREVLGTLLIVSLNSILTAGGVGGGAAYVPFAMLIFGVTLQKGIYIGFACAFGGNLGNLANTFYRKDPKERRKLINCNLNMIVLPALLIGGMIGNVLNRTLPTFITYMLLLAILAVTIFKKWGKLKACWKVQRERTAPFGRQVAPEVAENICEDVLRDVDNEKDLKSLEPPLELEAIQIVIPENLEVGRVPSPLAEGKVVTFQIPEQAEQVKSINNTPASASNISKSTAASRMSVCSDMKEGQDILALQLKYLERTGQIRKGKLNNRSRFSLLKIRELLTNIFIVLLVGFIRGTQYFHPIAAQHWSCTWDFLWFIIGIIALSFNLSKNLYFVHKWQTKMLESNSPFPPEEPHLKKNQIIKLILKSMFAGTIGAMVTLGGTIILKIILLDVGLPLDFSGVLTGMFMSFSLFNALFQIVLNGRLTIPELAWFLCFAFVFSFISGRLTHWYVKKTGKASNIVILIISTAAAGFFCLFVLMIKSLVENSKGLFTFTPFC